MNFNVGFSTTRSDVLVHLAQWQYWWWFWFAFLWSFYYLLATRIVRYRSLKMRPKISTSFRPHGKWGDFLAGVIPAIWCLNILTNSNFILRLLEWQNESSLFSIRVRARQWYWIYKFELKNFTDILSVPKNIGFNRWCINTFGDIQVAEDYLYVLQLRSQNKWIKGYWGTVLERSGEFKKNHIVSAQEQLRLNLVSKHNTNKNDYHDILFNGNSDLIKFNSNHLLSKQNMYYFNNNLLDFNNKLRLKKNFWEVVTVDSLNLNNFNSELEFSTNLNSVSFGLFKQYSNVFKNLYNRLLVDLNFENSLNFYPNYEDSSRFIKRTQGVSLPMRIIKYPFGLDNVYDTNYNSASLNLFNLRFNDMEDSLKHKTAPHYSFFSIKQKRYTKKVDISAMTKYYLDDSENKTKKVRYSGKPILFNNSIFENNTEDPIILYNLVKKNKKRNELIPVNLARRILRTKRTLVLPAHANITVITNSFDIVHSWFIPGLGIKLDCVPGRSTHHTFFIDNVGFYYGQCAEICGRYHHHMPIRVCALPFEHFLVWWYNFGLPKLLFTTSQKRFESYYAFRKYVW